MLRAEFKIKGGSNKMASIAMVTSFIVDGIAKDALIYRATDIPDKMIFKVMDYDDKLDDTWRIVGRRDIDSCIYNQVISCGSDTLVVELEKDYSFSIEIKR